MYATIENDNRPCLTCGIPIDETESPVLAEDPAKDPDIIGLYLPFCSMSCALSWGKTNGYIQDPEIID